MVYNDIAYGESLGTTGHHPKHSLAFKFYDDIYPTKLINVEFTMGKTGVLTPTAVFKPVEIDGTMVERASLHNLSVMKELGVEFIGQEINVYKSNQIIPQVYSAETIMPFKDTDDGSEKYPSADVFNAGIECSSKTMYPDWLSLTGKGYVPEMYKKYGRVVSPMGKCKSAHVKRYLTVA